MSREVPQNPAGEPMLESVEGIPTVVVNSSSTSSSSLSSSSSSVSTDSDQTLHPMPLRLIYPDGQTGEVGEQPVGADELVHRSGRSQRDGRVEDTTQTERADTSGARQQMTLIDEEEEEEWRGEEEEGDKEEEENEESGEEKEKKRKKKKGAKRKSIPPVLNHINSRLTGAVSRTRSIMTTGRLGELADIFGIPQDVVLRVPADNEVSCSDSSPEVCLFEHLFAWGMRLVSGERPLPSNTWPPSLPITEYLLAS